MNYQYDQYLNYHTSNVKKRRKTTMKGCKHRPCVVNGSKALFHKWTEKELLILKSNVQVKLEKLSVLRKNYEETGIVPKTMEVDKIKSTIAIVEFEDGTVKEVEPASIKFLDSGKLFSGYKLKWLF